MDVVFNGSGLFFGKNFNAHFKALSDFRMVLA